MKMFAGNQLEVKVDKQQEQCQLKFKKMQGKLNEWIQNVEVEIRKIERKFSNKLIKINQDNKYFSNESKENNEGEK